MITGKPCLRCLLRDLPGEEALKETLRELVGQIPEEERSAPETVEESSVFSNISLEITLNLSFTVCKTSKGSKSIIVMNAFSR